VENQYPFRRWLGSGRATGNERAAILSGQACALTAASKASAGAKPKVDVKGKAEG
jgi:hypothetical protein